MHYVDIETHEYPLSRDDIAAAVYPVIVPAHLQDDHARRLGYRVVHSTEPPAVTPSERAVEVAPQAVGDIFVQHWAVQVIDAPTAPVPDVVSMRQARLALHAAGLLGQVETALAALPEPSRQVALIEWEYAQEVHLNSGLVSLICTALGVSNDARDALFMAAAQL